MFDTSIISNDADIPLLIGKIKNVLGLMEDGFGVKFMTKLVVLKATMYA